VGFSLHLHARDLLSARDTYSLRPGLITSPSSLVKPAIHANLGRCATMPVPRAMTVTFTPCGVIETQSSRAWPAAASRFRPGKSRRRFLVAGRAMPIPLSTARGYLLHVHTLSNRLVRGGKSLSLELRGES
jgi:hypothetical protein